MYDLTDNLNLWVKMASHILSGINLSEMTFNLKMFCHLEVETFRRKIQRQRCWTNFLKCSGLISLQLDTENASWKPYIFLNNNLISKTFYENNSYNEFRIKPRYTKNPFV